VSFTDSEKEDSERLLKAYNGWWSGVEERLKRI
jgi:hypothetical protein